jgi:hypothetical protein
LAILFLLLKNIIINKQFRTLKKKKKSHVKRLTKRTLIY